MYQYDTNIRMPWNMIKMDIPFYDINGIWSENSFLSLFVLLRSIYYLWKSVRSTKTMTGILYQMIEVPIWRLLEKFLTLWQKAGKVSHNVTKLGQYLFPPVSPSPPVSALSRSSPLANVSSTCFLCFDSLLFQPSHGPPSTHQSLSL